MNRSATILRQLLKKKLATAVLITASMAACATLGDGGKKKSRPGSTYNLFSSSYRSFSLKSGYNYRGNLLFSASRQQQPFIMLNKEVTFQKGNATYVLPLKRKVLLDKVKFTPTPVRF